LFLLDNVFSIRGIQEVFETKTQEKYALKPLL